MLFNTLNITSLEAKIDEELVYDVIIDWMTCGLTSFKVPSSVKLLNCNLLYDDYSTSSGIIYCMISAKTALGVPRVGYYYLEFEDGEFGRGYDSYGESEYPSSDYTTTNVDLDIINSKLYNYWN